MLAMSCPRSSLIRCPAARANLLNSTVSDDAAVANAQAVWARFCMLNSSTRHSAVHAKALSSTASTYPAAASAQTMFTKSCPLLSPMHRAICLSNMSCDLPAVANAHATLMRFCALKWSSLYPAASVKTFRIFT
eukprot:gnl/TRDRNA2_/TRDRNA2_171510_c2_seq3.p1 gnl/TRDRNA2_/TRDRNA2_171510_c2~~gnl/TRDRNA2_/TRDRNA2_171510_c2_seq3.p1  ORF type:complete len:134 (-),score=9.43 gnl/TRDRNA2_/TRDRNA2_171510_c2_seq3:228-629(-)